MKVGLQKLKINVIGGTKRKNIQFFFLRIEANFSLGTFYLTAILKTLCFASCLLIIHGRLRQIILITTLPLLCDFSCENMSKCLVSAYGEPTTESEVIPYKPTLWNKLITGATYRSRAKERGHIQKCMWLKDSYIPLRPDPAWMRTQELYIPASTCQVFKQFCRESISSQHLFMDIFNPRDAIIESCDLLTLWIL